MTKNYFLDPKKFGKQTRNIILLYTITGIIALIVIFVLQHVTGTNDPAWLAIISIPVLLVFIGWRSIRMRKDLWENYILTLEDDVFIQNQPNYPETRVAMSSILSSEETKEGLYLSSRQGTRIFGIPPQLRDEDYEELSQYVKETLAARKAEGVSEETEPTAFESLPESSELEEEKD